MLLKLKVVFKDLWVVEAFVKALNCVDVNQFYMTSTLLFYSQGFHNCCVIKVLKQHAAAAKAIFSSLENAQIQPSYQL